MDGGVAGGGTSLLRFKRIVDGVNGRKDPHSGVRFDPPPNRCRLVARLDRRCLGAEAGVRSRNPIRDIFDKQARRKPLAFAADAGYAAGYGI